MQFVICNLHPVSCSSLYPGSLASFTKRLGARSLLPVYCISQTLWYNSGVTARLFPPSMPHSKRILDLLLSVLIVIVISPVILVVSLLVRAMHGAPVLFRQMRPGYRGEPFLMYKYRSMSDTRDPAGNLFPDEERLTAFGKLLRSTSMDELPELFNVLRGEMSLVGPRPLLMQYLERYTAEQARRHEVLPGITGWAQINGRNNVSWEDKFALDVWYVDHWSLWLDVKILLLTPLKVFKREGINEPGNATSREFMGTEEERRSGDAGEVE
jgi:sugar transferase EpsL